MFAFFFFFFFFPSQSIRHRKWKKQPGLGRSPLPCGAGRASRCITNPRGGKGGCEGTPPPLISELLREFRRRGSRGKPFPFGNKPSEVRTPNSDPRASRASACPETMAAGACQIWPQVQGPGGGSRGSPRPPWEGVAVGVAPAKRGNPFCLIPIGALWQ